MATSSLEPLSEEVIHDTHPLLMEHQENQIVNPENNKHEHVIDISRRGSASSSVYPDGHLNSTNPLHHEDVPPSADVALAPETSSSVASSRDIANVRRGDAYGRQRSPLNSGLWISFELLVVLSQIIAAIVVLSLSRNERPTTPLFEWIVCYTAGCVAILPHLYWRYISRNNHTTLQESLPAQPDDLSSTFRVPPAVTVSEDPNRENRGTDATSENQRVSEIHNPRLIALMSRYKIILDFFFALWFVVGNVWVFGRRSSASDAPNLYRLSIVFLTFSCIGYAMPFILCATICCCLPCIISILGLRDHSSQIKGASSELINSLPTYKFMSRRKEKEESGISSEDPEDGGVLGAGTEKERLISAEDAVCCICLARYLDNEDLRELPCTHFFHRECVDKWLKINALCPLCKATIEQTADSTGHEQQ